MRIRAIQFLGLAAAIVAGGSAFGQYGLSLQTAPGCNNTGVVTVDVVLASAPALSDAAGAQTFLSFDAALTCTSVVAGPGLQGVQLTFDNGARTVNAAVGVTSSGQRIQQGEVLATLTFSATGSACQQSGLVSFRTNSPPTRLTDALAQAISATTSNLNAITLNDTVVPSITGGATLTAINANADAGLCSTSIVISPPAATDNCGTPTISGSRSDMQALTEPFPVGMTTITWTATDLCGNVSAPSTQLVTVSDTQGPMISCGSTVMVNNDVGLCSAELTLTAPGVSDNCPGVGTPVASLSSGGPAITFPHAFAVGNTPVFWRVTDAHANGAECIQNVTVSDTELPVVTAPTNIMQNADAGGCNLRLTAAELGLAGVSDNCPGVGTPIVSISLNGPAIVFPESFAPGTTTLHWRVTDAAGNIGRAQQTVSVNPFNTVVADVELAGVSAGGAMTRCMTFGVYGSGPCALAATVSTDVVFVGGAGIATFDVPCGLYTGITATDAKHTLRRTNASGAFSISGRNYTSAFTSGRALQGGNVNNDAFIDILDFGGYIGQFGSNPGADSTCSLSGLHADFNGDGSVSTVDFNFITFGFLNAREADPCGGLIQVDPNQPGGPRQSVSVSDLETMGLRAYALADRNLDGQVDTSDVQMVLAQGFVPACVADFSADSRVSVQDLFDYLTAWFSSHPRSDLNNSSTTTLQDLFDYLNAWFVGC